VANLEHVPYSRKPRTFTSVLNFAHIHRLHSASDLLPMSGAEIAGFLLAAPPIIEYVVKFAARSVKKMEQTKSMKEYIPHLRSFMLEAGQIRLQQDMELGKRILRDPSVGQPDKDRLNEAFDRAFKIQHDIETNINIVLEKADVFFSRKRKVALSKLDQQTRDLEFTLGSFHDMVISLTLLQASQSLLFLDDHEFVIIGPQENGRYLNSGTFITAGRLSKATSRCTSKVQDFLFEAKSYKEHSHASVKRDLQLLAQRLDAAQDAAGVLPLIGFRDEPSKEEFHLVFQIDQQMLGSHTLLHKFRHTQEPPSLNFRMNLCAGLAEAILHVHSLNLVHKNVRPENILLVPDDQESAAKLFLLGWQFARETQDFRSRRIGEVLLERRIYQHPHRHREVAEQDYCMGHDIYSLGVCLLEILTWKPLLHLNEKGELVVSPEFKETFKQLGYDDVKTRPSRIRSENDRFTHYPLQVQKVLIALAQSSLPIAAGSRMAGIVDSCLTSLDSEEGLGGGSGFQTQTRNEKEIGADFADAVLKDIRSVCSAI
jgi:serine/threonine protein kinase